MDSIHKKVINLCISYIVNPWLRNLNTDFTLNNCFFGSADLTKNANPGKDKYSGYGRGFDFHLQMEAWEKNVIIFGVDMSSSVSIENKDKDI